MRRPKQNANVSRSSKPTGSSRPSLQRRHARSGSRSSGRRPKRRQRQSASASPRSQRFSRAHLLLLTMGRALRRKAEEQGLLYRRQPIRLRSRRRRRCLSPSTRFLLLQHRPRRHRHRRLRSRICRSGLRCLDRRPSRPPFRSRLRRSRLRRRKWPGVQDRARRPRAKPTQGSRTIAKSRGQAGSRRRHRHSVPRRYALWARARRLLRGSCSASCRRHSSLGAWRLHRARSRSSHKAGRTNSGRPYS